MFVPSFLLWYNQNLARGVVFHHSTPRHHHLKCQPSTPDMLHHSDRISAQAHKPVCVSSVDADAAKTVAHTSPSPDLEMGTVNPLRPPHGNTSNTGVDAPPSQRSSWMSKKLYTLIPGRLSFAAHDDDEQTMAEIKEHPKLFFFSTDAQESYLPFCADFGPVNLGTLLHFCRAVRSKMTDHRLAKRQLVYYFSNDKESASNAAFLLAAYLMLEHGFSIEGALQPFSGLTGSPIAPFRDATHCRASFALTLRDCLGGLKRARGQGWFDLDTFDLDAYHDMDAPEGGDMHRICPKFVAFRGPDDRQLENSSALPPQAYAGRLKALGVTAVVRLNEAETYDGRAFEAAGFRHCDLFFTDCTTPSEALVRTFLRECDAAQGAVAVHCLAGLGRTGTMIGAWLMRRAGFTAREAIGWLRIVRPGSVIGPQQHFLESLEARIRQGHLSSSRPTLNLPAQPEARRRRSDSEAAGGSLSMRLPERTARKSEPSDMEAATLAAMVEEAMKRRAGLKVNVKSRGH